MHIRGFAAVAVIGLLAVFSEAAYGQVGGGLSTHPVPRGECAPPGGRYLSDKIVRPRAAKGREVTERFGGGTYRVTRCDARGRLVVSQTVAPIRVPGGGRERAPVAISRRDRGRLADSRMVYGSPRDPVWAGVWRQVRRLNRRLVIPPTDGRTITLRRAGAPRVRTAQLGNECSDGTYNAQGPVRMERAWEYGINVASLPGGDPVFQKHFGFRILQGHGSWNDTVTDCAFSDEMNIMAMGSGPTGVRTEDFEPLPTGGYAPHDGRNTVDGGFINRPEICGAPGSVLACAIRSRRMEDPRFVFDADIRYESTRGYAFWPGRDALDAGDAPPGTYDVWALTAHEVGHTIGCDHVPDTSRYLTMHDTLYNDNTAEGPRTLGRGDILCLRAQYPALANSDPVSPVIRGVCANPKLPRAVWDMFCNIDASRAGMSPSSVPGLQSMFGEGP